MRHFIAIFVYALAFSCLAANVPRGWICRVAFSCFECKQTGTTSQGEPIYTASYNGDIDFWVCYWPNSMYPDAVTTAPTLTDFGLTRYCDLNGNAARQDRTGPFKQWLVQNMTYNPIYDNVDMSPFGDLSSYHGLGPMYQSDLGLPFTVDNSGNYVGPNDNFDYSSVNPLQGEQGPESYIYYDKQMKPHESSTPPSDGYKFIKDDNGGLQLVPYSSDGSSNVDLAPVISAVEGVQSRQDLLRDQLIAQLGAAGQSWVYDCKLSLEDLQTLVSALDTSVDTIKSNLSAIRTDVGRLSSNVGSINNNMKTFRDSLSSISSSSTTINQNILASSTERHTDLSAILSTLQSIDGKLPDGSEIVPTLPSPSLPDDSPDDDLPSYLQSFNWDVATPLSTVQGWTSETGLIKFGLSSLDGWLARFLHVPSVGSDSHMFTVDFDIPYLGHVQKDFSFADWPSISVFRQVALYALYVFFGLAIYKLFHKTLQ